MVTCSEVDCPRPSKSLGLCHTHYTRLRRYGSTAVPPGAKRPKHIPFTDWFWSWFRVNGECLDWTRHTVGGYGRIKHEGRDRRTHVIAWELTHGPVPDGLHVLHACDRPPCGRVSHLFLGTNDDNVADKVRKGRSRGNTTRDTAGRFTAP